MKVRGLPTLRRAGRWLRSRGGSRDLILLYHRVKRPDSDVAGDPFRLCVSPEKFGEHLEVLGQLARVVPLAELACDLESQSAPGGRVAITFDDGYVDNLQRAVPLLERHAAPATVFVVSGSTGKRFWWDRLCLVVYGRQTLPRRLSLRVDGRDFTWTVMEGNPRSRRRLLFELHRLLRPRPEPARRRLIEEIESWAGPPGTSIAEDRAMSREELVELSSSDLIEIGSHGVSHLPLADLPESAQRREITRSKKQLESMLGAEVSSFSYPYGQRLDVTAATADLVREAGYRRACTSVLDVVRRGSDPLRLPRFWVNDWTAGEFRARVHRWLGG